MKITLKDIEYLANLSALEFSENEKKDFLIDFNNILKMVDNLKNHETDIEEIYNKSHNLSELRTDEIQPSLSQDEVLKNAPKEKRGCFNVPLIVEWLLKLKDFSLIVRNLIKLLNYKNVKITQKDNYEK